MNIVIELGEKNMGSRHVSINGYFSIEALNGEHVLIDRPDDIF